MALKARAPRTSRQSRAAVGSSDKRVNVTLTAADYKRMRKAAFKHDMTMKAFVAEAITFYLDQLEQGLDVKHEST